PRGRGKWSTPGGVAGLVVVPPFIPVGAAGAATFGFGVAPRVERVAEGFAGEALETGGGEVADFAVGVVEQADQVGDVPGLGHLREDGGGAGAAVGFFHG